MTQNGKGIDWSKDCFREMLVYQRKSAIHKFGRDRMAKFYGLQPGMTIADIGCGLGFLGANYWKYFGEGGHYVGIDASIDLLGRALEGSSLWVESGKASFITGSAYDLPLADNSVDAVMCQTLLMHLEDPERGLHEMVRVVKSGGAIICQEPDNVSPQMQARRSSLSEESVDEVLIRTKVAVLSNRGRIKLGRGDNGIGPKVYLIMRRIGLNDVDVRTTEYVPHLYPPYSDEQEKTQIEMLQKQVLHEERRATLNERQREEFLAGGGTVEEWSRYEALADKLVSEMREQIKNEEYYYCGAYPFYYTRGIKPE